jgi:hypothetical protein
LVGDSENSLFAPHDFRKLIVKLGKVDNSSVKLLPFELQPRKVYRLGYWEVKLKI